MRLVADLGRVVRLSARAWRAPLRLQAVLTQLADLFVRSVGLTAVSMAFIGAVATVVGCHRHRGSRPTALPAV